MQRLVCVLAATKPRIGSTRVRVVEGQSSSSHFICTVEHKEDWPVMVRMPNLIDRKKHQAGGKFTFLSVRLTDILLLAPSGIEVPVNHVWYQACLTCMMYVHYRMFDDFIVHVLCVLLNRITPPQAVCMSETGSSAVSPVLIVCFLLHRVSSRREPRNHR